jgi:hypothetical protein
VHLVDDQQIELSRGASMIDIRQNFVHQRLRSAVFQPIDRYDQPRERREYVRPDAAITAQLAHRVSGHDPELQTPLPG